LFWVRKIFCEKAYERLFLALFAVQTGKKKDFVKICEFTRIHAKKCEFGSTVVLTKKISKQSIVVLEIDEQIKKATHTFRFVYRTTQYVLASKNGPCLKPYIRLANRLLAEIFYLIKLKSYLPSYIKRKKNKCS
jgi:hypothetical protein